MPHLPSSPTLPELQRYLADLCRERGWDQGSDLETFLLFAEEVGELAKAIRNRRKLFQEHQAEANPEELALEMADILSYLLDLANRFDVDLERAFQAKEAINDQRHWDSTSAD